MNSAYLLSLLQLSGPTLPVGGFSHSAGLETYVQYGQEISFSLHPLLEQLAAGAMFPQRELIGLCYTGFDIRCMQHEPLYSRLYMS